LGFVVSAFADNVALALAGLALAFAGVKGMIGPFWALGTACLSGTAAAAGIAWINSVGNLGGFVGPTAVGYIRQSTGSYAGAVAALGVALVILAGIAIILRPDPEAART
jgi:ACS family tartrate transporter-like MFS transporter